MASDEEWIEAMKAKGHMPVMRDWEDGTPPVLDIWVVDYGYHNGPGCSICGWSCCHHCEGIESIPQCDVITIDHTSKRIES